MGNPQQCQNSDATERQKGAVREAREEIISGGLYRGELSFAATERPPVSNSGSLTFRMVVCESRARVNGRDGEKQPRRFQAAPAFHLLYLPSLTLKSRRYILYKPSVSVTRSYYIWRSPICSLLTFVASGWSDRTESTVH